MAQKTLLDLASITVLIFSIFPFVCSSLATDLSAVAWTRQCCLSLCMDNFLPGITSLQTSAWFSHLIYIFALLIPDQKGLPWLLIKLLPLCKVKETTGTFLFCFLLYTPCLEQCLVLRRHKSAFDLFLFPPQCKGLNPRLWHARHEIITKLHPSPPNNCEQNKHVFSAGVPLNSSPLFPSFLGFFLTADY